MGFVSEELNQTEKQRIKAGKASNMAVVYGKEASIWKVRPPAPPAPARTEESAPPPPPASGSEERSRLPWGMPGWAGPLSPSPPLLCPKLSVLERGR